jgi:hypothetical protein
MAFFPKSSERESSLVTSKDRSRIDWRLALVFVTSLMLCWPATSTQARDVSRADVGKWLDTRPSAPNFKANDVLSSEDLERLRPFVPPGYLEQLDFPSFKMKVVAVRSHQPRQDYVNCTERYQAQVRLAPDGALTNHICGQPFSNASLNPSDPVSGLKAAWNLNCAGRTTASSTPPPFMCRYTLAGPTTLRQTPPCRCRRSNGSRESTYKANFLPT